ncbi:MAG: hypothetical protein KME25_25150 [Symplocastrum torsivum CPER-KK1]|jgi:hypothetical protein|uniref:Uncharacterized protein n=1 Tax=Symplocastrum torsivum CPER-KK1 TaxID=450513 RepID=A0A951PQ36_9CYAN|nr:hypothetical protein [Symplocastrum torsivum CPER-KK1]
MRLQIIAEKAIALYVALIMLICRCVAFIPDEGKLSLNLEGIYPKPAYLTVF